MCVATTNRFRTCRLVCSYTSATTHTHVAVGITDEPINSISDENMEFFFYLTVSGQELSGDSNKYSACARLPPDRPPAPEIGTKRPTPTINTLTAHYCLHVALVAYRYTRLDSDSVKHFRD